MDECKPLKLGFTPRADAPKCAASDAEFDPLPPGRAVQVDPIKPTLKVPGTERLKLKYHETLSTFAFKFSLRRCPLEHSVQGSAAATPESPRGQLPSG